MNTLIERLIFELKFVKYHELILEVTLSHLF